VSEPRTNQEVFDYVLEKLYAQGRPSSAGRQCFYRGSDGLKCAAGWLIPDTAYDIGMEGMAAEAVPYLRQRYDRDLIERLQTAHDEAARESGGNAVVWLRQWSERMQQIAISFGLRYRDPTPSTPAGDEESR
jgi:hypothetical protein